jgi:uncharacterized membrane protein YidH (DUF202 family)
MPNQIEKERPARVRNRRVHMANERTFLAWIRTSIGIMAFGFVVEKFALFLKQLSLFLGRTGEAPRHNILGSILSSPTQPHGYSSLLGICLVGLGALLGILSFVRFKKVERQIDADTYQPSLMLDVMLVLSILAIGVFLMIYLIHSI